MNALSMILRVIAILGAAAAVYFFLDVKGQLKDSADQLASTKKAASEQAAALNAEKAKLTEDLG